MREPYFDYTQNFVLLLGRAGLNNTPDNRRLIDRAVRELLGLERHDQTVVWKYAQQILQSERRDRFEQRIIDLLVDYSLR